MEHKAFLFDYHAFYSELYDGLIESLAKKNRKILIDFIEENLKQIKDPDEGLALNSLWKNSIEVGDIQEYADFALTKFYEPSEDIGLGYEWQNIEKILREEFLINSHKIIFGEKINVQDTYLNPGRIGSYFQSFKDIRENLLVIRNCLSLKPNLSEIIQDLITMFRYAIEANRGLYITF